MYGCLVAMGLFFVDITFMCGAEITNVEVGIEGRFKPGFWTPVRVVIDAGDQDIHGQLRLTTLDSDGVPVRFLATEDMSISAGETVSVTGYVRFGAIRPALKVEVIEEDKVALQRTLTSEELGDGVTSTDYLIVTLGQSIGVKEAVSEKLKGTHAFHDVDIEAVESLPRRWIGYEAVDAVAFGTTDMATLKSLSAEQWKALKTWVAMGGRVVISAATNAKEVFGEGKMLEDWSPGTINEVVKEARTSDVANYVSASEPLQPFDVALLETPRGNVQAFVDSSRRKQRPLITHYPIQLGTVSFVSVDLDAAPFSTWADRAELVARVLRANDEDRDDSSASSRGIGKLSHIAYDDLVGQVRATLDQFASVRPVTFSLIATLIGIYILLIGPGDYFFLSRIVRRMHWSWVTFPTVVVLFAMMSVWLWQQTRDSNLQLNQLEIIDIDVAGGDVRGTTWTHCYSPRADVYNLGVALDEEIVSEPKVLMSWQGLPGESLGGLDAVSLNRSLDLPYTINMYEDGPTGIEQLPLNVSSTKSLVCRWRGDSVDTSQFSLRTNENGELLGRFQYSLPYKLEDALLFYQDDVYPLKRALTPGQVVNLAGLSAKKLKNRLQSVKGMSAANKPYDIADTDNVPRMLDVIMFYDLAGGRPYANLSHRYQSYVDLSETVRNGRAILVGRSPSAATTMMREGESLDKQYDQRWTFVRLVIPVTDASEN